MFITQIAESKLTELAKRPASKKVENARGRFAIEQDGHDAPVAFGVIAFMEGHFITPTIIGRRLALNALAVLLMLAFWTWLWGPIGSFLASPLLIVALILKEHLVPDDSPQLPPD